MGTWVTLVRKTPTPLLVRVVASTGAPAEPGQAAPLSSNELTAIAEAVIARF